MDELTAAELVKLDAVIAGFDKVKFRAADIEKDGVTVKAAIARQLYIDEAWNILFPGCGPSDSLKIGRA
jgi:hypothetical protein